MVTAQAADVRAEEVVRRVTDAINRHDPKAAASAYSPDATVFDPQYPEPLRGSEAIARDFSEFFAAFPDLRMEVKRTIADGDTYAIEYELGGTHEGPLLGPSGHIPATHKSVQVRGSAFSRLDGQGRIVEEQRHYDLAGLLGQLGLMG